jgi:hypothetical protein
MSYRASKDESDWYNWVTNQINILMRANQRKDTRTIESTQSSDTYKPGGAGIPILSEGDILTLINQEINKVVEPLTATDTHTGAEAGETLNLTDKSIEDLTLQVTQSGAGAATVQLQISQDSTTWTTIVTIDTTANADDITYPVPYRVNAQYARYNVSALTATNVKCTLGANV